MDDNKTSKRERGGSDTLRVIFFLETDLLVLNTFHNLEFRPFQNW